MDRNEIEQKLDPYRDGGGNVNTRAMLRNFERDGIDALLLVYGPAPDDRMYTEAYELFEAAENHNEEVKRAYMIDDAPTVGRANAATNWLLPALVMLVSFMMTLAPLMVLS